VSLLVTGAKSVTGFDTNFVTKVCADSLSVSGLSGFRLTVDLIGVN